MRRLLVVLLVAVAVVASDSVVARADAAATGSKWSVQQTSNPPVPTGELSAVSCGSATTCTAVGDYKNSTGLTDTLAEGWNGTQWSVQSTPNPTGTEGTLFEGVSCGSATACTAVGFYTNSDGTVVALTEAWNGTSWSIESTPNPTGAPYSYLDGVSCSSITDCTAVGFDGNVLVEVWNGTNWSIQSTPSTGEESSLDGVWCSSVTTCTAVGSSQTGASSEITLAEAWNGTSWSIESTPNPNGAEDSSLAAVSCISATRCTAVGSSYNSSGTVIALAEVWDGTSWSIESTPSTGTEQSYFESVSCISATVCTAAGSSSNGGVTEVTLAEAWNGTSWSIESTPSTGAEHASLAGVSCTSATACTVAGTASNSAGEVALAEVWNGTNWSIEPSPDPTGTGGSFFNGVSCASATSCDAVGYDGNVTLAEAWNGSDWSVDSTPSTGTEESSLAGVSCTSETFCTAVGYDVNSAGTTVVLAEAWNGVKWSIQSTPDPSGAAASYLEGVSCTSAAACNAVGYRVNSAGTPVALAEAWNGVKWSIEPTPKPTGATASDLEGVSCTSAAACIAVGYDLNSAGRTVVLAEEWNGTSWAISSTPEPTGAEGSYLDGVSCSSATACSAVGHDLDSAGTTVSFAEAWNGVKWSLRSTPEPNKATDSFLDSVSCIAATSCTADGYYVKIGGKVVTFVEAWDGTGWAIQLTSPVVGAAGGSSFDGVSCNSGPQCIAVGYDVNSTGTAVTLAEASSG